MDEFQRRALAMVLQQWGEKADWRWLRLGNRIRVIVVHLENPPVMIDPFGVLHTFADGDEFKMEVGILDNPSS